MERGVEDTSQATFLDQNVFSKARPVEDGHELTPPDFHFPGQIQGGIQSIEGSFNGEWAGDAFLPSSPSNAFLDSNEPAADEGWQPIANDQPFINSLQINASHGQQQLSAVPPTQPPSTAGTPTIQSSLASGSAAQPSLTRSGTPATSQPPGPGANSNSHGASAPPTSLPVTGYSSQTSSRRKALFSLPSLITPASAEIGRIGSDTSRQHGLSGDDRGSTPGDSPITQTISSKPILKMKRTGQNFPISSPGSASPMRTPASLYKSSTSPRKKTGSVPPRNSSLSRTSERPPSRGPSLSTAASEPIHGGIKDMNASPKLTTNSNGILTHAACLDGSAEESEIPNGQSPKLESSLARIDLGASFTPSVPPPESAAQSAHTTDEASDDEIKHAATVEYIATDDALEEAEDFSSDDAGSDADETMEMGSSYRLAASPRQPFQPPVESDYGEMIEDDDAVSVSSSSQSSIGAEQEPAIALPFANIFQRQQEYPENILEMANSGRRYHTWWADNKVPFNNSGGALFPDGYKKCTEIPGYPWICAVRSCRQVYKTHYGLGNHFKMTHKMAMLNDNMDGTLSVVGSYKKTQSGKYLPVVVSRRPLDPNEPPMVKPTEPRGKGASASKSYRVTTSSESENIDDDDVLMGEASTGSLQTFQPSKVTQSGDADEMWRYIRPFLTVHRSIPARNWVSHIIHLPRVRDIKWNEPRIKDRPYRDSHPRDVTALIIQLTGVEAPKPCDSCLQGKGPFDGCIMIPPEASEEAQSHVLACANCYYHCGQSLCSHCSGSVSRRRRDRPTQRAKNYNVKLLSDRALGRASSPQTGHQEHSSRDATANPLTKPPQPEVRFFQPSEIRSLDMASKDRPYRMIKDSNGGLVSMCGALIPEGYDLDSSVPGRPWICPIRSCRAVFKRLLGLGSHFATKHRGSVFNDNQNGTLSLVGTYNQPLPGYSYCAPLVISRNPLDKNAPPMETPKIPGYVKTNMKSQPQSTKLTAPSHAAPAQYTKPKAADVSLRDTHNEARRIWNYILPFLPLPLKPAFFDSPLCKLFSLPLLQSVQWRKSWMKRRLDNDWHQVFALLIHVIGIDLSAASGERPCSLCTKGEGPFEGCWTLPRNAPWESHKYAACCANCLYTHKKHACSLKFGWERRCGSKPGAFSGPLPPVAEWAAAVANEGNLNQGRKRRLSASGFNEEPMAHRRRSERNARAHEDDDAATNLPLLSKEKRSSMTGVKTGRNTLPVRPVENTNSFNSMSLAEHSMSFAEHSAKQPAPEDVLEMEDWEIAPGRIHEDGADQLNNIAFSKSYLENNQMVPVSADVSFRVHTIKSGHKVEFEATSSRSRYCAVASGKLLVSIAEQPEFVIGPHGVFKLKPGVKAWVQNRLYIDSVLHITSVDDGK